MTNSGGWPFSILDDKYLTENVEDYAVSVGEQFILPNRPTWSYPIADSIWVQMHSISENCYNVYDRMIKQIRSDGGTFSNRPVSVKRVILVMELMESFSRKCYFRDISLSKTQDLMEKYLLLLFYPVVEPFTICGAQTVTVRGRVIDRKTGEVLSDANVADLVLGTGVATNSYGLYSIHVKSKQCILRCSMLGYATKIDTLTLAVNMVHDFALMPDNYQLNDVGDSR